MIQELVLHPEWQTMGDSMCYDSGTEVLNAKLQVKEYSIDVRIVAQGHVRVYYKDNVYKCASQFPQELLELFKNGSAATECDLIENNWWEVLYEINDGYVKQSDGIVLGFDPKDFECEEDIREYLNDLGDYLITK